MKRKILLFGITISLIFAGGTVFGHEMDYKSSIYYDTNSTSFVGISPNGDVSIKLGILPSTSRPEIVLIGGVGLGSTNTTVRDFNTLSVNNGGNAIEFASSSVDGDSFTIREPGVYTMTYQDSSSIDDGLIFGITKNSTQLMTSPASIASANVLSIGEVSAVNKPANTTVTTYLSAGDVIRAQANTTANESADYKIRFRIIKITD